jgi:hypothetical protein
MMGTASPPPPRFHFLRHYAVWIEDVSELSNSYVPLSVEGSKLCFFNSGATPRITNLRKAMGHCNIKIEH